MSSSASHNLAVDVPPRAPGTLLAMLLWVLALSAMFASTLGAMVSTWLTSETFTHGILVAPISLWLGWRMRVSLLPLMENGPSLRLLAPIPLLALMWLAGKVVSVQVVMQLAYVAMLVAGLAAIMGAGAARRAVFPLGFLFLAVPMGIGLEQPMMDLTAKYTVKLIQLTGIPVFQEGRFFQLPSGSWSVVEACSGVRYLIASFTLGLLYAHISYRSLSRKLAFVLASIVVPVIANVLRAYLIVMLGHLSNMKLATGVDHLIYGWIFFGVVMLLLFWVGGWWAEAPEPSDGDAELPGEGPGSSSTSCQEQAPEGRSGRGWLALLVAVALAALVPGILRLLHVEQRTSVLVPLPSLSGAGWLCEETMATTWEPRSGAADRRVAVACENGDRVQVVADQYLRQEQGREVADYFTGLKGDDDNRWRVVSTSTGEFTLSTHEPLRARLALLRSNATGQQLVVAAWYLVNSQSTASPVGVKLLEGWQKLRGVHRISSRVYVAVPVDEERSTDEHRTLENFLRTQGDALNVALSATVTESPE